VKQAVMHGRHRDTHTYGITGRKKRPLPFVLRREKEKEKEKRSRKSDVCGLVRERGWSLLSKTMRRREEEEDHI